MPDEISPEDRERLARTKFGEWFDEFFEKKFKEAFDVRVKETYDAAGKQVPPQSPSQQQPYGTVAASTPRRRRSLLEECFSDAFHIG